MKTHISKLDAAKRQLETAINFFFRSGDPVSIHSLTGGAFQILEDISIKRGEKSFHLQLLDQVKEEKKEEVRTRLSAAKNFFKHADKDPEGIIDFNPESTVFYIWDACRMYLKLTHHYPPLFQVFVMYFNLKNPEIIQLTPEQKTQIDDAKVALGIDVNNPISFLQMIPFAEGNHYNFK